MWETVTAKHSSISVKNALGFQESGESCDLILSPVSDLPDRQNHVPRRSGAYVVVWTVPRITGDCVVPDHCS